MELNQYLDMFLEESKEHLQVINERLLRLEDNPNNLTFVQEIFRSAHTLKGMSATMGFEPIAHLTHEMENLLDMARNEVLSLQTKHLDILFACVDQLEAMVETVASGENPSASEAVEGLVLSLKKLINGEEDIEESNAAAPSAPDFELTDYDLTVMQQFVESGAKLHQITVTFRADCVLKAVRAYMVFQALENMGELVKTVPDVESIEKEMFDQVIHLILISDEDSDKIKEVIEGVSEIDNANVSIFNTESLMNLQSAAAAEVIEAEQKPTVQSAGKAVESAGATKPEIRKSSSKTIRVDIERLDGLMNLFSELIIDKGRLELIAQESKRGDLKETVEHLSRISGDMQNIILMMRMVQIDQVFNRFPRMVRDLAKDLNKMVDLQIEGADTELDRTVIDEIGDPLVHILRNAIDHGLETTQDRIKAGKPETGIVKLTAYHSGNHVFIDIEDDGKGIDRSKVLAKAIERNIVTQAESDRLSDHDVYQLLFAPGFSTADKISDISGRGVGLDVVKNKIESLSGSVFIRSELNKGTQFSIQLPLTLSIISSLLVEVGDEKFAIPLNSIVETAHIKSNEIKHIHNQKVMQFREKVVPLISLKQMFGVSSVDEIDLDEDISIVIIKKGDKLAGLIVDTFIGQQEIVLKSLGSYLSHVFAISGATILGDGSVVLIVDCNALIN